MHLVQEIRPTSSDIYNKHTISTSAGFFPSARNQEEIHDSGVSKYHRCTRKCNPWKWTKTIWFHCWHDLTGIVSGDTPSNKKKAVPKYTKTTQLASYPWTIAIAPVNITSANRWLIEGCTISLIFGIFSAIHDRMLRRWSKYIAMQIASSMSSNIPKEYVANLLVQHRMKLGCIASRELP